MTAARATTAAAAGVATDTTRRELSAYADPALYDLVYSWYDPDLAFYVETARAAGGPVLELACGTGRVLLPTLAAGVDIEGLDLEPAMLERLRAKAEGQGLTATVHPGDMRDFTLPRRYALATIPFRAFMHLLTTDDQIKALARIRHHLAPGGRLVMNQFYPSFEYMASHHDRRVLELEFDHAGSGRHVQVFHETHYDHVPQILRAERDVVLTGGGRADETLHSGFTLRWAYRFEIELLLRAAGFARWEVRGGFDGRPLATPADEMVWTAVNA